MLTVSPTFLDDDSMVVMQEANKEAQRRHHGYIGTEHILLALIECGGGITSLLRDLGIDPAKIRSRIEEMITPGPDILTLGKLPFVPRAKKTLEYAYDAARKCNVLKIQPVHILIGLLQEEEGLAAQVLLSFGLTLQKVEEALDTPALQTLTVNVQSGITAEHLQCFLSELCQAAGTRDLVFALEEGIAGAGILCRMRKHCERTSSLAQE